MSLQVRTSPMRLLAEAQNAAGDRAASAAALGNHAQAREWTTLAVQAAALARRACEIEAR